MSNFKFFNSISLLLILFTGCSSPLPEPYRLSAVECAAMDKASAVYQLSNCVEDAQYPGRYEAEQRKLAAARAETAAIERQEALSILNTAVRGYTDIQKINTTSSQQPVTLPSSPTQATSATIQTAQQQTSRSDNSPVASSSSQPVMQCVLVTATKDNGWFSMKNTCDYVITVAWCYSGTSDCRNGNWGYTNIGNISAGTTRDASTFIGRAERKGLVYAACSGRDIHIKETGPKTFNCN